jgi:secreted trypsin-like serine protease
LIYLVEPVQVAPAQLHQQKPSWDAIAGQHTSLVFVGYGFNVIGDEKVGIGIKREGVWPIDSVSNLTFAFAVTGLNTCYGDSGGPAFIESAQLLLVAGVTSRGDEKCTQGIDTRVDAYGSWLTAKIR